jgi:hypothetical protein
MESKHTTYFLTLFLQAFKKVKKGKAVPVTDYEGPWGCEMLRLPYFMENWLTAVRLSALCISHPLPPWKIPGTHFC